MKNSYRMITVSFSAGSPGEEVVLLVLPWLTTQYLEIISYINPLAEH